MASRLPERGTTTEEIEETKGGSEAPSEETPYKTFPGEGKVLGNAPELDEESHLQDLIESTDIPNRELLRLKRLRKFEGEGYAPEEAKRLVADREKEDGSSNPKESESKFLKKVQGSRNTS